MSIYKDLQKKLPLGKVGEKLIESFIVARIAKKKNLNNAVTIAGSYSGLFYFGICRVTCSSMWRFWNKVNALRELQGHIVQPLLYRYKDLKLATRDFHNDNFVGEDGFVKTYKGEFADGTVLAVKLYSSSLPTRMEFLEELVLTTGIKHKNLVQLKGCCINEKQPTLPPILVYEYVENGNLREALDDAGPWLSRPHGGLNWENSFNICVGVARGLSYLHEELQPSIIHRDIKPGNILLDMNLNPKISEFGLARSFSHESSEGISGTLGYIDPDYICTGQFSTKVDVYGYGVVVLEVISGRKAINFPYSDEESRLVPWVQKKHSQGLWLDILQPKLRDNCVQAQVVRAIRVGLLCTQLVPTCRPSMSQVVNMLLGNMDADEEDDLYSDPITLEIMCDPVSCSDGRTYCRWTLIDNGMTRSPYDRTKLTIYCDDITARSRLFRVRPEQESKFRERRSKHREEALQHARADPIELECAIEKLNDVLLWDRGDAECQNELARTLSLACQTFLQPSLLDTIPEVMHEDVIRARLDNEGALFLTFLVFFYIAIGLFIF